MSNRGGALVMWSSLDREQKDKYKRLITNFASLSKAFAQKSSEDKIIAPIINSKFQESVFKYSFNAIIEDIGNSSYDASVILEDNTKYIVGIKSFGVKASFQKVAQFKADSQKENWNRITDRIKERNTGGKSSEDTKDYLELAQKIAILRNKRISSSKSQLQGFNYDETVQAVYHVLMPSPAIKKQNKVAEPYILVGETSYSSIDIENIKIEGPTQPEKLQNFQFFDGKHRYQYNSADSQLLMSFRGHDGSSSTNADLEVERWPVEYIDDALAFFEKIKNTAEKHEDSIIDSVTFMINIKRRSGFNAWYGSPKDKLRIDGKRVKKVLELASEDDSLPVDWIINFKKIVLGNFKTNEEKIKREELRDQLINELDRSSELFNEVTSILWRNYKTPYEVYIPIPDSKNFNNKKPNFFAPKAGILKGKSLVTPKEERIFDLIFLPSGENMKMFLNQDNGKAIQSVNSQFIFGEWVLKNIFQLKDRELLTEDTLESIGINAIRFVKYSDRPLSAIFIYVDKENPPEDLWE